MQASKTTQKMTNLVTDPPYEKSSTSKFSETIKSLAHEESKMSLGQNISSAKIEERKEYSDKIIEGNEDVSDSNSSQEFEDFQSVDLSDEER